MKYLKWILIVVFASVILVFIGAIVALNSDSVHRNLEAKVSSASGFDTHLGRFGWAFPLRIRVGPSTLESSARSVSWQEASVSVTRPWPPFGIDLFIDQPKITLVDAATPAAKTSPPTSSGRTENEGAPAVPSIRLKLRIRDGEVLAGTASVKKLDLSFFQAQLMQSPARVTVDGLVRAGPLPAPIPLHLETDSLTLTPQSVAAEQIDARVAGVLAKMSGQSDLTADKHRWALNADAADLKAVPKPAREVCDWSGAVKLDINVAKDKAAIDADGVILIKELSASLGVKMNGAEVDGPVRANVDAEFGFHQNKLNLPKALVMIDAGGARINSGEAFTKNADVPLTVNFEAKGASDQITVSKLDARLGELRVSGGGRASTVAPFEGRVAFTVAPVALDQVRPLLPALAKLPAGGTIAAKGALEGPLGRTDRMGVSLERATLDGPLGALAVSGRAGELTSPRGPRLDLTLTAAPLKLDGVKLAVPAMKTLVPDGQVRARAILIGIVALGKPWAEWPLDVRGDISASVPEYKVVETTTEPPPRMLPAKGEKAPPPATGFVPKGYLTEHLNLKVSAAVARVLKGPLVVQDVSVKGELAGGHFRGDAGVGRIFDGKVSAHQLDVPLVQPRPAVSGELTWVGITIERAVGFAKPEFKDFANGQTAGQAKFKTRLPDDPDFMSALEAAGRATARPVTLNSVKVGEIINNSLGKIPALKIPPVKVAPLRGLVQADFKVKDGVAEIPGVLARDADDSELNAAGKVRLKDLNGDFTGTFAWAKSPLTGCAAEANADGKGRVVIPLSIKGDLMHPGFNVVGDLLTKFGGKIAECEGKKLLQKAQKDGLEGLKKEGGKLLKGLFGK